MQNMPFQHSNVLAQEIHEVNMVKEPHGPLKQGYWSAGKADVA